MKAIVVVDNISNNGMKKEWGLCIYIEYQNSNILLDTGGSNLFVRNAKELGIQLQDIDYAVLSHAHYDHANGMKPFFLKNKQAKFYLRDRARENCYFKKWVFKKYIGIPKGICEEYKTRIEHVSGDYTVTEGVTLVPHKATGLEVRGKRENMYRKEGKKWVCDDFAHEQSLVLDTPKGLVIFNSCSHGGADTIIREVANTFKDKKVYALIGGFHLFNKSKEEVQELARKIKQTGISQVYTGHCTGDRAYGILEEELGSMLHKLEVGLTITI